MAGVVKAQATVSVRKPGMMSGRITSLAPWMNPNEHRLLKEPEALSKIGKTPMIRGLRPGARSPVPDRDYR